MTPIDPRNRPAEPKSFASWTERAARHHQAIAAPSRPGDRQGAPAQPPVL